MFERPPPRVLVVAREYGSRSRIAAMLEEAGIAVTVDDSGAAVLTAAAGEAYDLVIIVQEAEGCRDAASLAAAARALHPELALLCLNDPVISEGHGAAGAEPRRRFVGCVRERLLSSGNGPAGRAEADEAESVIAMAQIACLHRRREAACRSGAVPLAEELHREIGRLALRCPRRQLN